MLRTVTWAAMAASAIACASPAMSLPEKIAGDMFDHCYQVVPSDSANLPGGPANGIFIRGAGTVVVEMMSGALFTIRTLDGIDQRPFRIKKVMATGTSVATTISGFLAGIDACR
jgi:hypothetical protein